MIKCLGFKRAWNKYMRDEIDYIDFQKDVYRQVCKYRFPTWDKFDRIFQLRNVGNPDWKSAECEFTAMVFDC